MLRELPGYVFLIPAALLCFLPMKDQLRFGWKQTLFLCTALFCVSVSLHLWLKYHTTVNPDVFGIFFLLIFYLVYRGCLKVDFSRSIAVFAAVTALMSILSGYATCYDAWIHPALTPAFYSHEFAIVQILLSCLALILLGWPVMHYGSRIVNRLQIPSVWLMTLPFMTVLFLMILIMKPQKYETFHINRVAVVILFVLSAMLFMWLVLCITFYHIVTVILDAAETSEKARILEMQEKQFQDQQKYMENSARARHDFRQTIRTLQELAQSKNLDALADYINKYAGSLPENDTIQYCRNYALNALLNYYRQIAEQNDIRFTVKMDLPETLRMSDVDLCVMIGNILDNAEEACKRLAVNERFIDLNGVNREGKQFILVATNSCDEKLKDQEGIYLSTKKNGTGMGLLSVRLTAEEYGGNASFSNADGCFCSNVLIPLK